MRRLLPLALLFMAFAARADEPQDWSKSIETVVVIAHPRGPLMWHVVKGNSEVVLFAIVEPLPRKIDWNKDAARAAFMGAKQLLLPPRASANLFDMLWLLAWNSDSLYLPDTTTVESTLPADLRARFTARRESFHGEADRYSDLRPPLAALRLEGDFLKARDLTSEEPIEALKKLAREAGASPRFIADYPAVPMIKQLPTMPQAANDACVKAALDDMDAIGAHAAPMAEAWAAGDLDGIKANYSENRFESCIQSMPSFAAMFNRAVKDSENALNAALARPGKTVMAVPLGALLRKDGLLDRIKAEGLTADLLGG